jgi:hypothetical protein
MLRLQIIYQRRRKLLVRLGALLALGAGAVLAIAPLPRADANDIAVLRPAVLSDAMRLLLLPAPVASRQFLAAYTIAYH